MSLASGTKLGPYEIQSPLGSGGMGDVYRARDTRLSRDVALKILPESFVLTGDRLQRFETEARAVAALNHPNILAVFDIGQHNSSPYMVSELLDGRTLREVLQEGPLPQRKAIEYAVQIAQGLASAHEKGIVHRDVKPENIFIMRDGRVKILDFGLAKQAQAAAAVDGATMTSSHTAAGMVLGTAGYMSPEQVRGDQADARSDIFAFGAVLYEMLCGIRAFHRDTTAETMTAILREDPPELSSGIHPISPALDRIVRRCIEKDPEQRFQSAKDLSFALSALSGSDSSVASRIAPAPAKVKPWIWTSIALAAIVVAVITWLATNRSAPAHRVQFAIPVSAEVSQMALSPNGSMLALVSPDDKLGMPVISVQRVGSPDIRALPGTEGASYPFWSPDGANLGFFANGKLQKIAIAGGPPQALANIWAARGGSWSKRNVIIYEPDAGMPIWKINTDGSGAAPLTEKIFTKADQSHRWPMFLPDGNHFLFWAGNFGSTRDAGSGAIYESSLDKGERKLLASAHSSFAFDSHHLYYANDEQRLVSVPFDSEKEITGGDTTVLSNMVALQPSTYWAALTASENGTVVYNTEAGASASQLTWMDRTGKQLGQIGPPAVQYNPTLSPDDSHVAVDISDQRANNVDIWLESTTGVENSRFTFDPSEEVVGVWSRDGKFVTYRTAGGAQEGGLFLKASDGLDRPKFLFPIRGQDDIFPNSWSLGDTQVLVTYESASGYGLRLVPVAGGTAAQFNPGPGNQSNGMISPDGKWVAYASDESGSWEIYVATFPGAAGKWQVSRGGGAEARWRGDGKELFYLAPGGMLTSVAVSTIGTFSSGTPMPLFQFHGRPPISSSDIFSYDVAKDGKRFLVNRYVKPEKIAPLTIILNAGSEP